MAPGSLWRRCSAAVSLLLHLLVAGLAPLADARLEASSAVRGSIHVEDQRAPGCRQGHNHQYCLICRALHALDLPPSGPMPVRPDFADTSLPCDLVEVAAWAPRVSALGPRAPPAI